MIPLIHSGFFVSLKNERGEVVGVKFSKIFRGVSHKGWSDRFKTFFWGVGYVKRVEVKISGWG